MLNTRELSVSPPPPGFKQVVGGGAPHYKQTHTHTKTKKSKTTLIII